MKSSELRTVHYVDYRDEYAKDFADINYAWLEEFFEVVSEDMKILENPVGEVIEPGGQIFFALVGGKPVGTVALQRKDKETFELVKMGVLRDFRGLNIGKGLLDIAIKHSQEMGKKRILLETNTGLASALRIYQNAGFRETTPDPHTRFSRVDLWMELILQ